MNPVVKLDPSKRASSKATDSVADGAVYDSIDGDDFRRLGVRVHEWRPSVIRRAASRHAKGLARRLLRHQSSKATQQLSAVSVSTYRLLDPRRRDDAHARAHIGRIVPQTISSADARLFSGEVKANAFAGVATGAAAEIAEESVAGSLVADQITHESTTSLHHLTWASSQLLQDDILAAGVRTRRRTQLSRRFGVVATLVGAILIGSLFGLRSVERTYRQRAGGEITSALAPTPDAMPGGTPSGMPGATLESTAQPLLPVEFDWAGPRVMPLPNPDQMDVAEVQFRTQYAGLDTVTSIDAMQAAIVAADLAAQDDDPNVRYVSSLRALSWSWFIETAEETDRRLLEFVRRYDLEFFDVVTRSYVAALQFPHREDVLEPAMKSLPLVVDFLRRVDKFPEAESVLEQADLRMRQWEPSVSYENEWLHHDLKNVVSEAKSVLALAKSSSSHGSLNPSSLAKPRHFRVEESSILTPH